MTRERSMFRISTTSCCLLVTIQWIILMYQSLSCFSFQMMYTSEVNSRSHSLSFLLDCNHRRVLINNTPRKRFENTITWASRKSNGDYYRDDDDDDMEDADDFINESLRGRGKKRTKVIDEYDDVDFDNDDDEDDEYDDEFITNEYELLGNELIPNPLLDSIDPDGAAERFPELAQDPKFWFEMLLFVAFLDFVSYAGPRNPFPDGPIW